MNDPESIELTTMTFTADQMAKVPEPHREFFFCCCMATNEVNTALRLNMMALESFSIVQKSGDETILQVAFSSMTIAERNIAAKLYEVFHLLKEYPMVDQQLLIDKLVDGGRDAVEQNELDHHDIKELVKSFIVFHYNFFRRVWKVSGTETIKTTTSQVDARLILKRGRAPLPVIFTDQDGD